MLDRFDRTDRLVRLGVATLAGMVAVVGFLISHGPRPTLLGSTMLGASILVVMLAVYLLARINTSLHREVSWELGPDLREMLRIVRNHEMSKEEYHLAMADQLPDYIDSNQEFIRAMSARQGLAIRVTIAGVVLHLVAIAFILGGTIFG